MATEIKAWAKVEGVRPGAEYGTVTVTVEVIPDTYSKPRRRFSVRGQFNPAGDSPAYGPAYCYGWGEGRVYLDAPSVWGTTLAGARDSVKALAPVEAGMERLAERFGRPETFGAYVAHLMDVLKADQLQVFATEPAGLDRWLSPGYVRDYLDDLVARSRRVMAGESVAA